jgi:hypothetical protein
VTTAQGMRRVPLPLGADKTGPAMWEYKIYELPYELERCETELNAMGSEEWEVVGVAPRDWVSSGNSGQAWASPTVWIILRRVQRK